MKLRHVYGKRLKATRDSPRQRQHRNETRHGAVESRISSKTTFEEFCLKTPLKMDSVWRGKVLKMNKTLWVNSVANSSPPDLNSPMFTWATSSSHFVIQTYTTTRILLSVIWSNLFWQALQGSPVSQKSLDSRPPRSSCTATGGRSGGSPPPRGTRSARGWTSRRKTRSCWPQVFWWEI